MTDHKKTTGHAGTKSQSDKKGSKAVTKTAVATKTAKANQKKSETPRAKATGGKVTVMQTRSRSGHTPDQVATLTGLGLNKIGSVRTLEDTEAVRGMIRKVAHLIKIVDAA